MSSADNDEDEMYGVVEFESEIRAKIFGLMSLCVLLVHSAVYAGILWIPDKALNVPMEFESYSGTYEAVYMPVPETMALFSVLLPVVLYFAYNMISADSSEGDSS